MTNALVHRCYGPPGEVLNRESTRIESLGADDVLVAVRASSINPADLFTVQGKPYVVRLSTGLRRPKNPVCGRDLAGVVLEVGANVHDLSPGDEVYGESPSGGGYGEQAVVPRQYLSRKPATVSFEQAAVIPLAGVTALQGLRDQAKVTAGQRVLIIGASGGVGTLAVQLAKHFGAHVTGVCSGANLDLVQELGADATVDYQQQDLLATDARYDAIFDLAGSVSPKLLVEKLSRDGTLVLASATGGPVLGPVPRLVGALVRSLVVPQKVSALSATPNADDLAFLTGLVEAGSLVPVVRRTVALADVPDAMTRQIAGQAKGKTAVAVES